MDATLADVLAALDDREHLDAWLRLVQVKDGLAECIEVLERCEAILAYYRDIDAVYQQRIKVK